MTMINESEFLKLKLVSEPNFVLQLSQLLLLPLKHIHAMKY